MSASGHATSAGVLSRGNCISVSTAAMRSRDARWRRILPPVDGCGVEHVICPDTETRTGIGLCAACPKFMGIPPLSGALLCAPSAISFDNAEFGKQVCDV